MASTSVHIANMKNAITEGLIPGSFNANRTEFSFDELEYNGVKGVARSWQISVTLLKSGEKVKITDSILENLNLSTDYVAEIRVISMQVGGKIREIVPTHVTSGKNIGKKNATNCISQALRDALSLYNKQKRKSAATATIASATPAASAAVNMPPMLVKKIGDSLDAKLTDEDFENGVTVQRKYNGVHYVAYWATRTTVRGYSRTGTEYIGQKQIIEELQNAKLPIIKTGKFGITNIEQYKNLTPHLDGELYLEGMTLNWISGQARKDDDSKLLKFYIFDVFFTEIVKDTMLGKYRQQYLDEFFALNKFHFLVRVENFNVGCMEEVEDLSHKFVKEGYEGAIARKDMTEYQYGIGGYHSANILKIKPKYDSEFIVVDFTQGTKGKDVGAVVWICEVPNAIDPNDKTFNVVPKNISYQMRYSLFALLSAQVPDPHNTKKQITRFERDIKGLPLTVEYAEISKKTGKPLQAKALIFRTYESASEDPVKKLMREAAAY